MPLVRRKSSSLLELIGSHAVNELEICFAGISFLFFPAMWSFYKSAFRM